MKTKKIDDVEYKVNYGTLKSINKFKTFVGEETFNNILNGVATVDIPFEEEKYSELLNIILIENKGAENVTLSEVETPYHHAEALVSFFCEPFAGKLLKQAKSTLDGMSSLLAKLSPEVLQTVMASMQSQTKSGSTSDAVN